MTPTPTVIHGDCLAVLRDMADSSVHAVVCDPPYGLSNTDPAHVVETLTRWAAGERDYVPTGRGFMGKSWDAFVPPPAVWDECLRVLKPGGHLLAFAGSRTFDLMTLSIRFAGFDIRDSIAWLYGCLTDDAEILTAGGWKRGVDVQVGELVAQWDPATEAVSLAPVQRTYLAPYSGPMRVLRNADTDQVLTPNHRVYHRSQRREMVDGVRRAWFDDGWQVAEAADVTRHQPTHLPLSGYHDGPGIGGTDYAALLGWVWTEGGFDRAGNGVRIYQSPSANPGKVRGIDDLLDRLAVPAKRYERERTYTYKGASRPYTEVCWFFTGDFAARIRADLPGKHPTFDLLFAMTQAEKVALYQAAMLGDGSGNAFDQKHPGDLEWFATLLHLIGKRGRVTMRPGRDTGVVNMAHRGTTQVQPRHFKAAPDETYTGDVWCVSVPTGAFVARRNGLVFVTGNSGFPKSLDVSKAIDKQRTEDREPVDAVRAWLNTQRLTAGLSHDAVNKHFGHASNGGGSSSAWMTNPTSRSLPTWEQWQELKALIGFNDSLDAEVWRLNGRKGKPGDNFEAREVLSERVAIVEGGNGGWSDMVASGRFRPGEKIIRETAPATPDAARWQGWGTALKPAFEPVVVARKPLAGTVAANVLAHGTGALNIDATRVEAHDDQLAAKYASVQNAGARANSVYGTDARDRAGAAPHVGGRWPTNVVLDGHAADALDEQSGHSRSPSTPVTQGGSKGNVKWFGDNNAGEPRGTFGVGYGDSGGASRFFPTFREQETWTPTPTAAHTRVTPPTRWRSTESAPSSSCDATSSEAPSDASPAPAPATKPDWPFRYQAKAPTRERPSYEREGGTRVAHPTVKPVELMRWLVRLVTPPGGTVLDPFAGSGATVEAALLEGFDVTAIEREADYLPLIQQRIDRLPPA